MAASSVNVPKRLTLSVNNHSFNNTHKSIDIDDDFDHVQEISDFDNTCPNQTTISLMKCKKEIILPFRKLLCLIGWRPFGADNLKRPSIFLRITNIVYPIFIFILLLFNYTYEIIICQGKLNVITDTHTTTTPRSTVTTNPTRNYTRSPWAPLGPGKTMPQLHEECGHIFTTYILPDIFHCLAFIIGLIHFRITEGEPLYSLMEKVFINADQNIRVSSTNRAIQRLNLFMIISCIWVIISVAANAFYNAINDFAHTLIFGQGQIVISKDNPMRYTLFAIDIICLLVSNCIHVAVVMNYVCHCEMILFYCKAIRLRLEEKSMHLLESMKRILDLGASISQLNSAASRMMSILIIIFLERTILGVMLLVLNRVFEVKMWVYRSLYVVIWISILVFCLVQASRVANKCNKFCRLSLSIRVYGYHNATPSELDGFLLFLSQAELRVKLFGLTVRPGKIICIGIAALLILVVLFQTSIISSETFFF